MISKFFIYTKNEDLGTKPIYINSTWPGLAMAEMADMVVQGKYCWLSRVQIIERLVKLPIHSSGLESKIVGRYIKAKFASFWLQKIVAEKPGPGGLDHTNLLTV